MTGRSDTLDGKVIAVTGGSGLVGSHVVAELLGRGHRVRLLMRDTTRTELLRATLRRMGVADRYDRLDMRQTALNNPHELRRAVEGVQVMFHCAAQVSFDPGRADELVSVNTEITTHVANSCLACGVELLVHVSSIAALGDPPAEGAMIDEECVVSSLVGKSAYSVSKIYSENAVRRAMLEGLRAVIVNPSIVIGEGDWCRGSSMLVSFGARRGLFYTPGVKGYVDVRDVARAMVCLAETPGAAGQRYVVSSENISFRDFFSTVARAAGRRSPRIGLGAPALRLASRIDRGISRLTGREHLLPDSVVENALHVSRYSSEKLLRATGFRFTPVREAIERVTREYLKEKCHGTNSRHYRRRR